jgi:hypothetical protein
MKRHEEMLHAYSHRAAGYPARQLVAMWGREWRPPEQTGRPRGKSERGTCGGWRWRMFHICMFLLYCCRRDDTSKSNRMSSVGRDIFSSYRPLCMSVHVKPILNLRVILREWEEERYLRGSLYYALRLGRWASVYVALIAHRGPTGPTWRYPRRSAHGLPARPWEAKERCPRSTRTANARFR